MRFTTTFTITSFSSVLLSAVINAKLSLESSIRQTQREEGALGAAVKTISDKVDTIDKHIDQVMEDAPTKLKVTVTVCDTDWQKMQELHAQWIEQEKQMLADHEVHDIVDGRYDGQIEKYQQGMSR